MPLTDYLTAVDKDTGNVETSPETSNVLGSMGGEMPMEGVKKFLGVGSAIAAKVLELMLPLAGTNSEEGQRLQRALRTLNPLTKGVSLADIKGLFTMLQNVVTNPSPMSIGGVTPSGISEGAPKSGVIEEMLKGGGAGGAGAAGAGGAMGGGGMPPMPPTK